MDNSSSAAHPAMLAPGTVVGNWRVDARVAHGVYGAVYRAVPLHDGPPSPVALKLALHPEDPRFAREAHLLCLFEHPSIPRLLDHGAWRAPGGALHPFLIMQWVDGVPLYEVARAQPSSQVQVWRWLAQLADALAALQARGVVHRDLKGANVLVRRSDGRAMLVDFGTGSYPGAATLTPPQYFPGTPAYRSPESWLFELRFCRDATARYRASPADDLYALGVTACSLLTGQYPEPGAPSQDEHGTWHLESVLLPRALLSGAEVDPRLREVILRWLSVHPEQRGTAAQWTKALALSAEAPASSEPHVEAPPEQPSVAKHSTARAEPRAFARRGGLWLALAASLALALWAWPDAPGEPPEEPAVVSAEAVASEEGSPDAGTRGLGEAAAATSMEQAPVASFQDKLAEEPLPEPQPGQLRPNAKGRCPHKGQMALNKGCWLETSLDVEGCAQLNGQMFKGRCYVPIIPPGRPPTSSPTDKP